MKTIKRTLMVTAALSAGIFFAGCNLANQLGIVTAKVSYESNISEIKADQGLFDMGNDRGFVLHYTPTSAADVSQFKQYNFEVKRSFDATDYEKEIKDGADDLIDKITGAITGEGSSSTPEKEPEPEQENPVLQTISVYGLTKDSFTKNVHTGKYFSFKDAGSFNIIVTLVSVTEISPIPLETKIADDILYSKPGLKCYISDNNVIHLTQISPSNTAKTFASIKLYSEGEYGGDMAINMSEPIEKVKIEIVKGSGVTTKELIIDKGKSFEQLSYGDFEGASKIIVTVTKLAATR